MPINRSLHVDSIGLGQSAANSDEVLRRISELAVSNPIASRLNPDEVFRGLKDREGIGSTAMGRGVAIPHFASDKIDEFVVGLLTLGQPVDFRSADSKPSDVFVFIIGPRKQRDTHIKLLSSISKFLLAPDSLERIRGAADPAEIHSLLVAKLAFDEESNSEEKVLFQIFIQNLDYFEDVLNLMSSIVPGSISVIETRNAGTYLFSMPLFAAFWSTDSSREGRVIVAVVDREVTNSLIRQIQEITGDPDEKTGLLVTVQDLSYVAGSLTF